MYKVWIKAALKRRNIIMLAKTRTALLSEQVNNVKCVYINLYDVL